MTHRARSPALADANSRAFANAFAVALALTPAIALAAPSPLERIRAQGELRWAGDLQGGEPYVFRAHDDPSKLVGFEVEIAERLARSLGVKSKFMQNDWHNLVPSLERGDFDVAMNGIEDTPALHGRVLLSRPYVRFAEQLVVRTETNAKGLDDLKGKRIGTLANSLAHQLLRAKHEHDIKLYEGQEEPYRDLKLGRLEGVLLDSLIAARYGLVVPGLKLADADVARGTYVLAVRKGETDLRDALDAALETMERNGELKMILARWKIDDTLAPPKLEAGPPNSTQAAIDTAPPATEGAAPFDAAQVMLFIKGAGVTLLVSLLAMSLAAPLGLLLALMRLYGSRPIRIAAHAYVELFRGTPVLLHLYLLYYGVASIIHLDALTAAVLGLGLNYAAYEAEVHRAAIGSLPIGQTEAAAALGMSRFQALRFVLLPQSLRTALPAMTNDLIALLKDSSLVSVITVVELTKQMTITAVDVRSWALPGALCAGLYFVMSYPLSIVANRLEERLSRHEEPDAPAPVLKEAA